MLIVEQELSPPQRREGLSFWCIRTPGDTGNLLLNTAAICLIPCQDQGQRLDRCSSDCWPRATCIRITCTACWKYRFRGPSLTLLNHIGWAPDSAFFNKYLRDDVTRQSSRTTGLDHMGPPQHLASADKARPKSYQCTYSIWERWK